MKKSWIKMVSIILFTAIFLCSCGDRIEDNSELQMQNNLEAESSSLKVYLTGHENSFIFSSSNEKITEFSTATISGLEYTMMMPGYASGHVIYQALLDFGKEKRIEIKAEFFGESETMMQQLENDIKNETMPDLVIDTKTFTGDWNELLEAGLLQDLSSYMELDSERYYENVLKSGCKDGNRFVVPFLFNVNGYITTEEFLQKAGAGVPDRTSTYQEMLHLFQTVCNKMTDEKQIEALYEASSIWSYHLANVLTAAAGYGNLENHTTISQDTIEEIYDTMDCFYQQEFVNIADYTESSFRDNLFSTNSKWHRVADGPTILTDPIYKPSRIGIQLDGGYGGMMIYSSFLMNAYSMLTYYEEQGLTSVIGAIPIEGGANHYAANVTGLGFCPSGSQNVQLASEALQYLLDYPYPLELGFSVNREQMARWLDILPETSMQFYIMPTYTPGLSEEMQQQDWDQTAMWFQPMKPEMVETIQDILENIDGATLPNTRVMSAVVENLRKYLQKEIEREEALEATMKVIDEYWNEKN